VACKIGNRSVLKVLLIAGAQVGRSTTTVISRSGVNLTSLQWWNRTLQVPKAKPLLLSLRRLRWKPCAPGWKIIARIAMFSRWSSTGARRSDGEEEGVLAPSALQTGRQ
jgi:hypothetical protein